MLKRIAPWAPGEPQQAGAAHKKPGLTAFQGAPKASRDEVMVVTENRDRSFQRVVQNQRRTAAMHDELVGTGKL